MINQELLHNLTDRGCTVVRVGTPEEALLVHATLRAPDATRF